VPGAEPLVSRWRDRLDPYAPAGVPAHVTVLAPFLDAGQIGAAELAELRGLFASHPAFDATFPRCARFPGVLYLAPEPAGLFRALTGAVVARWPEAPPYGGRFPEVVPHLTVACSEDQDVLDRVEAALAGGLPVRASIASAQLLASDQGRWTELARFPLGG
jgi:2'-5' RNA ligase superfamily